MCRRDPKRLRRKPLCGLDPPKFEGSFLWVYLLDCCGGVLGAVADAHIEVNIHEVGPVGIDFDVLDPKQSLFISAATRSL